MIADRLALCAFTPLRDHSEIDPRCEMQACGGFSFSASSHALKAHGIAGNLSANSGRSSSNLMSSAIGAAEATNIPGAP